MSAQPYFDQSRPPSDEPGRFVRVDALDPLVLLEGLEFRPITTDSVMINFVTFEPNAEAPMHHHLEQQIAVVLSGTLTFTVGTETRVMTAGPDGCTALDVFTPPRAGIVEAMAG